MELQHTKDKTIKKKIHLNELKFRDSVGNHGKSPRVAAYVAFLFFFSTQALSHLINLSVNPWIGTLAHSNAKRREKSIWDSSLKSIAMLNHW